jgi:DNA mismatch endonuclease (patch repair protein)
LDNLSAADRKKAMSAVRGRDTTPERRVRSLLHSMGLRFRLHRKTLPGCPDIVLPKHRAVIFVHGCFWHGHTCRKGRRLPVTNANYWLNKITRNKKRDRLTVAALKKLGWQVLVLWECRLDDDSLEQQIATFLTGPAS